MEQIAQNLASMHTEQVLLVIVFVASYALALGTFAGRRGRIAAAAATVLAGAGLIAFGPSVETGILLVAAVPVGMAGFAALAWMLWFAAGWPARRTARSVSAPVPQAPPHVPHLAAAGKLLSRAWQRLHPAG